MESVGDSLFLHTVEVSGNADPCEHPDNSFGEEIVLTSGSVPPSFGFVAISENVLWIRALLLAVPSCAWLSVVSPSGYSVAQADVETMRSFLWIYSCSLPLYLYRCVSSA